MTDTTTAHRYTHLISDERWGVTCLVDDVEAFVRDMEESMFPASVVADKLAELQEIAAERDEECEETAESVAEGWRNELRAALQDVEPVTLSDGHTGWMTSGGSVYLARASGLASYVDEWDRLRQTSLSTVAEAITGDSLVYNDRGNGCGGPGYEESGDVADAIDREEREGEDLTLVTESEDAEAWTLARDAFRLLNLDPQTIRSVAVGERAEGDNGHQMVYCW